MTMICADCNQLKHPGTPCSTLGKRKATKPTRQQTEAFKAIYDRPLEDGPVAPTYLQFRRTIRPALGFDCYMVKWCGMWLGIETDGYIHS